MPLTMFFSKNRITRELSGKRKVKVRYDVMDIHFCCKKAEESYNITYKSDDKPVLHLQIVDYIPDNVEIFHLDEQRKRLTEIKYCYHCGEAVKTKVVREAEITFKTETIEKTIEETTETPVINITWEDPSFRRKESE